jgi:hypothetical protein
MSLGHPLRFVILSKAKDLLLRPAFNPKFVIPTEAQRSGGTCISA